MKSKMIKKIFFLMLFIIGCSINNSDSEWTQYQKLEYKVADDYLGYQFDYEDLTIRLELPAFYVLNYSDGSQRNIDGT